MPSNSYSVLTGFKISYSLVMRGLYGAIFGDDRSVYQRNNSERTV